MNFLWNYSKSLLCCITPPYHTTQRQSILLHLSFHIRITVVMLKSCHLNSKLTFPQVSTLFRCPEAFSVDLENSSFCCLLSGFCLQRCSCFRDNTEATLRTFPSEEQKPAESKSMLTNSIHQLSHHDQTRPRQLPQHQAVYNMLTCLCVSPGRIGD